MYIKGEREIEKSLGVICATCGGGCGGAEKWDMRQQMSRGESLISKLFRGGPVEAKGRDGTWGEG